MKKLTTTIILLLTIMISYSQQNYSELVKKYEGEQFVKYSVDEREGFRLEQGDTVNMIILKNKYGRFSGVNIVDENNETKIKYTPGDWKLDNPSQPAFSYMVNRGGYVSTISSIDGMIFDGGFSLGFREKFSPDIPEDYLNNYEPSVSHIYVPISLVSITTEDKAEKDTKTAEAKTDDKKAKKKGFMANLSKGILNTLAVASGNGTFASVSSKNLPLILKKYNSREILSATVKEYTTSMKAKQKPLTAQDKQDYAYVQFQEDSVDAWIKGENDEFWQSEEGQERIKIMNMKKAPTSTFTIKNNSGQGIDVKGSSIIRINNGESATFSCNYPVYYAILVSTSWKTTGLITDGKGICGTTINL